MESSHTPDAPPTLMRKRVARACENCRGMKSKCDGLHPSCGRCVGYGHECRYSSSRRKGRIRAGIGPASPVSLNKGEQKDALDEVKGKLKSFTADLEGLINGLAPNLAPERQPELLARLSSIGMQIDSTATIQRLQRANGGSPTARTSSSQQHLQRYLGEVSDVRFFNLVDRVLQEKNVVMQAHDGMDSYEQDDLSPGSVRASDVPLELPNVADADRYLDIYFSTIHVAYPFLQKTTFMSIYRSIREDGLTENAECSWLALLHVIFAIGAYYTSFSERDPKILHEHYFQKALSLSNSESMERSVNQVSFLLAECFYLLAICRTDRCWTILGLAIRVAQSIGLHVEQEDSKTQNGQAPSKTETRRRAWYSLYVLDRLLSLQLGRPPAIHDQDFNVLLPSRLDDAEIRSDASEPMVNNSNSPSVGDYFLSVISLSRIIGYVLRDLYSPRRDNAVVDISTRTRLLDKQLLDWKWTLPRTLRFDFGHTFETSLTYRRQRNMLAVKFHHLRALIHRPYLCLRLLRPPNDSSLALFQGDRQAFERYEATCISEARETAHLLHNVSDEKELVHDFPWWQMISCLICASSILLVASVFAPVNGGRLMDEEIDITALNDDSETCLKVFEALSANSEGAKIARDMMNRLKDSGLRWRDARIRGLADPNLESTVSAAAHLPDTQQSNFVPPHCDGTNMVDSGNLEMVSDNTGDFFGGLNDWPSEILDSMTWSVQFLEVVQDTP